MSLNRRLFVSIAAVILSALFMASSPATLAKTRITVGLPGGSLVHSQAILQRFEELHPDIAVETIPMSWDEFFDKLMLMLVTGTAPDVWYGEAGRALSWYSAGFTLDLGPLVEQDLDLDSYFFLDAARDPLTGAWTGIPSDFQVTSLFYNYEHFHAAGIVDPDATWSVDELLDAAKKLTIHGSDTVDRWGFVLQPTYITPGWMLWTKLLGGRILDETRTRSLLDQPETVAALEEVAALMHQHGVAPPPGAPGYMPVEAVKTFRDGLSSMMFNIYAWNRDLATYGMDTYDVQVVPRSPGGERFTTAVPNVWVINAASPEPQKKAAWEWIKFQIGEEAQAIRMAAGAGVPVNRQVAFDFANLPSPPRNRAIYLDSYEFAGTLEENPVWAEYTRAIEQELLPLWSAEITAREAAERAHVRVQAILDAAAQRTQAIREASKGRA